MVRSVGSLSRRRILCGIAQVGAAWLGLSALAGCQVPGLVVPAKKPARIGLLSPFSQAAVAAQIDAFRQGMHDLGYVDGQNYTLIERYAAGDRTRYADLVGDLVQMGVDLIVVSGAVATAAVKQATSTIPIVTVSLGDPVGTGIVASLARPGGNVTGVSGMAVQLSGTRLELLRDAVQGAGRFAAIWETADAGMAAEYGETRAAARALGVELMPLAVLLPQDLDRVYAEAADERVDGVVIIANTLMFQNRARLVGLALQHRLPTISSDAAFAAAGGLISYGPDPISLWRRSASFVDRILKGNKPAEVPVEQPMRFDLVINLNTARALGLTIPRELLLRATDVIDA